MDMDAFRRRMNSAEATKAGNQSMAADFQSLTGQVRVNGSGESKATITFPISFSQKPLLTFGGEIQEGDRLDPGRMPTVSVVVLAWLTKERPPYSRLYTGAILGIVTGGPSWQKMIIHWKLDGIAYTNPV